MATSMDDVAQSPIGRLRPRRVVKVDVDDQMWKVVAAMVEGKRGAVLVMDGGKLTGIFTERDVMTRLDHTNLDWNQVRVGDVMTPHPTTISTSDTVAEAMRRVHEGHLRHLPVVDAGTGQVVSLISIRDLLAYIAERFAGDFVNLPPRPGREASGPWGG
jgi:CBS domain-containing protein